MVSRVLRATPPNEPADGDGRIKAKGLEDNCSILVLSPSMLPFERSLEGSIANTASFFPCVMRCIPKASINVLFPTPGTPVMPIRRDLPE